MKIIKNLKLALRSEINRFLSEKDYLGEYNGIKWKINDLTDLFHGRKIIKNGIGYNGQIVKTWIFNHVIDIGCNKGFFPLWLLSLQENNEFSYLGIDADRESVHKCKENLKLNLLLNLFGFKKYLVFQLKIGPRNSIFISNPSHPPESKISGFHSGVKSAKDAEDIGFEEIEHFNFNLDKKNRQTLLKVDIEGAEYFLFGKKDSRKYTKKYKYIVVEYHKPMVSLVFLREKLKHHHLIHCEEYDNVGYGYFERKD